MINFNKENWSGFDYSELLHYMSEIGEEEYKAFNLKIIPGAVEPFGIRIPILRKLAKEISKGNFYSFLRLPHTNRHEEVILRGLVMANAKVGYNEMLSYMKSFAGDICNWAICDTVNFKGVKNFREQFWQDSYFFTGHNNPWFIRFGLCALMNHYLDDEYINEVLRRTNAVKSDFYYVKMMQAWLYATAAAKHRSETMNFLLTAEIDPEVLKMTAGKMRDSYRVSAEDTAAVKARLSNAKRSI